MTSLISSKNQPPSNNHQQNASSLASQYSSNFTTSKPYKVIISISRIKINKKYLKDLVCVLKAEGQLQRLSHPFKDILSFELSPDSENIDVSFVHKNKVIAGGQLIVPEALADNFEVETTERLTTTIEKDIQDRELVVDFIMNFLNSRMFEDTNLSIEECDELDEEPRDAESLRDKYYDSEAFKLKSGGVEGAANLFSPKKKKPTIEVASSANLKHIETAVFADIEDYAKLHRNLSKAVRGASGGATKSKSVNHVLGDIDAGNTTNMVMTGRSSISRLSKTGSENIRKERPEPPLTQGNATGTARSCSRNGSAGSKQFKKKSTGKLITQLEGDRLSHHEGRTDSAAGSHDGKSRDYSRASLGSHMRPPEVPPSALTSKVAETDKDTPSSYQKTSVLNRFSNQSRTLEPNQSSLKNTSNATIVFETMNSHQRSSVPETGANSNSISGSIVKPINLGPSSGSGLEKASGYGKPDAPVERDQPKSSLDQGDHLHQYQNQLEEALQLEYQQTPDQRCKTKDISITNFTAKTGKGGNRAPELGIISEKPPLHNGTDKGSKNHGLGDLNFREPGSAPQPDMQPVNTTSQVLSPVKTLDNRHPCSEITDQVSALTSAYKLTTANKNKNNFLKNRGNVLFTPKSTLDEHPPLLSYFSIDHKNSLIGDMDLNLDQKDPQQLKNDVLRCHSKIKFLNNTVYSLHLKLKNQEVLMKQLSELKEKENHYELNQEELKQNLFKITKKFKDQVAGLNTIIDNLKDEKAKILKDQVETQTQQRKNLYSENYFLKIKCASFEKILEEKEVLLNKEETFKQKYSVLLKEYTEEKAGWLKSYSDISHKYSEVQEYVKKFATERAELREEIKQLTSRKVELEGETANLKLEIKELKDELDGEKVSKMISEQIKKCTGLVAQKCIQGESQLKNMKKENNTFAESFQEKIDAKMIEISENDKNLKATIESLTKEREIGLLLQKELNDTNNKLIDCRMDVQELKGHINTLEQLLYVKSDVYNEYEKCKNSLNIRNEDCESLRLQIKGCVEMSDLQKKRIYELENDLLKCKRVIGDKEDVSQVFELTILLKLFL